MATGASQMQVADFSRTLLENGLGGGTLVLAVAREGRGTPFPGAMFGSALRPMPRPHTKSSPTGFALDLHCGGVVAGVGKDFILDVKSPKLGLDLTTLARLGAAPVILVALDVPVAPESNRLLARIFNEDGSELLPSEATFCFGVSTDPRRGCGVVGASNSSATQFSALRNLCAPVAVVEARRLAMTALGQRAIMLGAGEGESQLAAEKFDSVATLVTGFKIQGGRPVSVRATGPGHAARPCESEEDEASADAKRRAHRQVFLEEAAAVGGHVLAALAPILDYGFKALLREELEALDAGGGSALCDTLAAPDKQSHIFARSTLAGVFARQALAYGGDGRDGGAALEYWRDSAPEATWSQLLDDSPDPRVVELAAMAAKTGETGQSKEFQKVA